MKLGYLQTIMIMKYYLKIVSNYLDFDRSDKTHPYDPLNPRKYRKRGGGVMIAVNRKLDIQSKKVGIRVKVEILSV